jgi:hypothetical protein
MIVSHNTCSRVTSTVSTVTALKSIYSSYDYDSYFTVSRASIASASRQNSVPTFSPQHTCNAMVVTLMSIVVSDDATVRLYVEYMLRTVAASLGLEVKHSMLTSD